MYIRIYDGEDYEDYSAVTNLSFAPEADLVGASVPINEFQADIRTDDAIDVGGYAALYDDGGNLWAKYWIVYAERESADSVRVKARSDVALLDRVTLPAVYYSGADVGDVLDATIVRSSGAVGLVIPMDYTLDSSLSSATITGFCPEQTARERLLWVCFVIGAYVKTFFNDEIEIVPIAASPLDAGNYKAIIPPGDTYMRPTVNYLDWVTAVRAKYYSFTQGTPETTDRYVTDANGVTYIVGETETLIQNTDAPSGDPENIVDVDGVYLINSDNVSGVLTRLALWYFPRLSMDLDVIDNAAYAPGDKVAACADEETLVSGFIESATFTFGVQAKAALKMMAVAERASGRLTITYVNEDGVQIGRAVYLLPVGYVYEIENPYIDITMNGHRYVYRPLYEAAEGAIVEGENTDEEECAVALDFRDGILEIVSVDGAAISEGVVAIS